MLGESTVHLYPAEELVAADFSISSYELRAQRIETIDHMARSWKRRLYYTDCRDEEVFTG